MQGSNVFPVIFHNFSGYVSHLLGNSEGNSSCIPNIEENYISFTKQVIVDKFVNKEGKEVNVKRELKFIDSLRFMAASLDNISSNLKIDQFLNLKKHYSGNQLSILFRKCVYPHEYVDFMKKLDETSHPPKVDIYSKFTGGGITDEDYQHGQTIWKSMKDYHNLYNMFDVLLLADTFENFRNICMNNYGLDPAWHFSAPGIAWDAALIIIKGQL